MIFCKSATHTLLCWISSALGSICDFSDEECPYKYRSSYSFGWCSGHRNVHGWRKPLTHDTNSNPWCSVLRYPLSSQIYQPVLSISNISGKQFLEHHSLSKCRKVPEILNEKFETNLGSKSGTNNLFCSTFPEPK